MIENKGSSVHKFKEVRVGHFRIRSDQLISQVDSSSILTLSISGKNKDSYDLLYSNVIIKIANVNSLKNYIFNK